MKRFLTGALISTAVFVVSCFAQPATAFADAAPYADRAVRFVPPPDFESVPVPSVDLSEQSHLTPVAAYVRNRGREERLSIFVLMEPFDGPLSGFEATVESDLRAQIDGLFVSKKELTRLPNGMPAYWLKLAYGEGFSSMQEYLYAAIDGRRGIAVAVSGRLGIIDEAKAKEALKNLAVVLYP